MRLRYRVELEGTVQGVGLRWQIYIYAKRHELAGWVKNTRDGKVKLEIEGPKEVAEAAVDWIIGGALTARVVNSRVDQISEVGDEDFVIIR